MIDERGRVKLLDFGLALQRPAAVGSAESTADALSGALVGTLPYMAPEQPWAARSTRGPTSIRSASCCSR